MSKEAGMRILPLLAALAALSLASCSTLSAGFGVAETAATRTVEATSNAVNAGMNRVMADEADAPTNASAP
jgi:hypothetical protein